VSTDYTNREQIADLLLFESMKSEADKYTTLPEYVQNMPAGQEEIYYLTGESRSLIEHAPTLEVFRSKGWDVLLMTDPIDEFILPSLNEYKGKHLKAADKGEISGGDKIPEDEQKRFEPLFADLKKSLEEVKEIRLSTRLKESASCLVSEEGALGAHMERLMQKFGQSGRREQRVLELNGVHPAVQALNKLHAQHPDDPRIESAGRLLYDQALVAEGSKPKDPAAFARRINELITKTLGEP
jgi:molecular chaperone HtpG